MKHTISLIMFAPLCSVQHSLSMEYKPPVQIAISGPENKVVSGENGNQPPVQIPTPENQPPIPLYPVVVVPPAEQAPKQQQQNPIGESQLQLPLQPPILPPAIISPSQTPPPDTFYTRVHWYADKLTGFVDIGAHGTSWAYNKYPVTTKLFILGAAGFFISRSDMFKKWAEAVQRIFNQLIGSSDIDNDPYDEDDEEERDAEINKSMYNDTLLQKI